jgi:hypothetical protein
LLASRQSLGFESIFAILADISKKCNNFFYFQNQQAPAILSRRPGANEVSGAQGGEKMNGYGQLPSQACAGAAMNVVAAVTPPARASVARMARMNLRIGRSYPPQPLPSQAWAGAAVKLVVAETPPARASVVRARRRSFRMNASAIGAASVRGAR